MTKPAKDMVEVGDGPAIRSERRDAAEHRRRILACARELFDTRGIDSVSMHQIAQAAGVGQGTLYRCYGHKGDLCMDILRDSGEAFLHDAETFIEGTYGVLPALARVDGLIQRALAFIEAKSQLLSAMHDAFMGCRRDLQYQNPYYTRIHEHLVGLFREALDAGEIAQIDPVYVADALLAALSVELYIFQRQERGFSQERIFEGARRLYRPNVSTAPGADE